MQEFLDLWPEERTRQKMTWTSSWNSRTGVPFSIYPGSGLISSICWNAMWTLLPLPLSIHGFETRFWRKSCHSYDPVAAFLA